MTRALSVASVFQLYRTDKLSNLKSGEATGRSLCLLLDPLGRLKIDAVTEAQLMQVLTPIAQTAPVHANRILAYARAFFAWALERRLIDDNPARALPPFARETVRARRLDIDEVVTIWIAAGALGRPFATAFWLLIATAAQRDQVGGLRVSELHRDRDSHALIWSPTGQSVDGDEPLRIRLSPLAQGLIEAALPLRRQGTDYILGRTGRSQIDGWAKAKVGLDEALRRLSPCQRGSSRGTGHRPCSRSSISGRPQTRSAIPSGQSSSC